MHSVWLFIVVGFLCLCFDFWFCVLLAGFGWWFCLRCFVFWMTPWFVGLYFSLGWVMFGWMTCWAVACLVYWVLTVLLIWCYLDCVEFGFVYVFWLLDSLRVACTLCICCWRLLVDLFVWLIAECGYVLIGLILLVWLLFGWVLCWISLLAWFCCFCLLTYLVCWFGDCLFDLELAVYLLWCLFCGAF